MEAETVEWVTPQRLFNELDAIHHFTLDAASTHENAKCKKHFTIAEDGLSQSWAGETVWLNPPYSKGARSGKVLEAWLRKALEESRLGATVVCLVPVRSDTGWWHDYCLKGEIKFLRGRVKFLALGGTPLRNTTASIRDGRHAPNAGAPFPSAIVTFKPR